MAHEQLEKEQFGIFNAFCYDWKWLKYKSEEQFLQLYKLYTMSDLSSI